MQDAAVKSGPKRIIRQAERIQMFIPDLVMLGRDPVPFKDPPDVDPDGLKVFL